MSRKISGYVLKHIDPLQRNGGDIYLQNIDKALTGSIREAITAETAPQAELLRKYVLCPESWQVVPVRI